MCKNSIWDLINSTINRRDERDVQTAFFLYIFIKQSSCLGAWWPEGRSSSLVFQSLPSCSWSACQMAVNGKDGYRGDSSPWWFLQLCFCSVWGRWPAERGEQTLRCAQLNALTTLCRALQSWFVALPYHTEMWYLIGMSPLSNLLR